MPFFGRVALSMLFSIKNCTCMQILVTSSKNADMLLIPPVRNWTITALNLPECETDDVNVKSDSQDKTTQIPAKPQH